MGDASTGIEVPPVRTAVDGTLPQLLRSVGEQSRHDGALLAPRHPPGVIREHVEVIFETFHDGSDSEERLNGVLDYYDECTPRLDLAHIDREEPPTAEPQSED